MDIIGISALSGTNRFRLHSLWFKSNSKILDVISFFSDITLINSTFLSWYHLTYRSDHNFISWTTHWLPRMGIGTSTELQAPVLRISLTFKILHIISSLMQGHISKFTVEKNQTAYMHRCFQFSLVLTYYIFSLLLFSLWLKLKLLFSWSNSLTWR